MLHILPALVSLRCDDGAHPVRAWREFRGFSQTQLALVTGISRAYLAQIEAGERTGTLEIVARLARVLDCLIEQLMPRHDEVPGRANATLAAMPAKLKAIVDAVPERQWRTRPRGGGFSLVEHLCHLRDIDGDGYSVRIERMLAEERPVLPDINGEQLAAERDYLAQDAREALDAFTTTRWAMVGRLGKLGQAERRRIGLMAGITEIDVDGLVSAMLTHDSEHLDELTTLAAELSAQPH
jgi:transcriptional regulator with XRE-family HTH domain